MHEVQRSTDSSAWHDHVVLCGLGTAGVRIAEALLRSGVRLIVVDNGPVTPFRRSLAEHGVPIVVGDCTEHETLHQAGIGRAAAVLIVINNDMVNLQAALVARELNTNARIVIRLFNQRMAQHLQVLPARVTAVSLSAAAAPVFVLAARCRSLCGAVSIHGTLYALGSLVVPADTPLTTTLQHWRSVGLVAVACTTPEGHTTLCPPPSTAPPPGSRLLVIAQAGLLQALTEDAGRLQRALREPAALGDLSQLGERTAAPVSLRARLAWPWSRLRLLWRRAGFMLRLTLLALLALLCGTVIVFHFSLGLSAVDALYFAVTLVTTVGLGDLNFLHDSTPLKLYGIFVMLGGATLMAVLYALIAQFVLDARIEELLGVRPETARDHYVVAGLGTVGIRVVRELLAAGEQVVVIESSDTGRFIPQLRALGVPLVLGDAALEETLRRAHIAQARALIAVTNNDLANTEAVLNGRAIQPDLHLVLRVFDPTLARQARHGFAIPASLSASLIGAHEFARAALGYEPSQVLELPLEHPSADHHAVSLTIRQMQVTPGDGLCGRRVEEIATEHGGLLLLHLPGGQGRTQRFLPDLQAYLQPGDLLALAIPGRDALGQLGAPPALPRAGRDGAGERAAR